LLPQSNISFVRKLTELQFVFVFLASGLAMYCFLAFYSVLKNYLCILLGNTFWASVYIIGYLLLPFLVKVDNGLGFFCKVQKQRLTGFNSTPAVVY